MGITWNFVTWKSNPQWHICFNKAIPPTLYIVSTSGDHSNIWVYVGLLIKPPYAFWHFSVNVALLTAIVVRVLICQSYWWAFMGTNPTIDRNCKSTVDILVLRYYVSMFSFTLVLEPLVKKLYCRCFSLYWELRSSSYGFQWTTVFYNGLDCNQKKKKRFFDIGREIGVSVSVRIKHYKDTLRLYWCGILKIHLLCYVLWSHYLWVVGKV